MSHPPAGGGYGPGDPYPPPVPDAAPYGSQPYPGQPYPGQPYPGQPYPGQPYPGQPYPGQPYPGQPYPGQPGPLPPAAWQGADPAQPLPATPPPPGPAPQQAPPQQAAYPPPPLPSPGSLAAPPPMPAPVALPDPGALDDPAVKYRTEQTRNYPCPQCGGQLVFNPRTQGLRCSSCGHEEPIELTPTTVAKHDLGPTMGELRALIAQRGPSGAPGGSGGSALSKEIVCQACGGHTTFTGSLTAIRCPYCNTPIQRDDLQDAPLRLPIDGVLPLAIDEDTARGRIEKWINGRWFAPNEFKKYRELGSFTSIYLAYFSYDVATTTDYRGERGRNYTVTVGEGQNRRTETRVDWTPAWGRVTNQFADLTGCANTGLDAGKVAALEPWPTQQARGYDQRFVSGHLARTYDKDAEQVFGDEVVGEVEAAVDRTIRSDIGGDQQRISSRDIRYDHLAFAQLLLPVWLLTVTYGSRPFQVVINGMTGEVQGQRPYSGVKIGLTIATVVVVLIVAFVLYRLFGG